MREIYLEHPLRIIGFKETTNNKNELNSQGVIPQLWNTFCQSEIFEAENTNYAVYFNYKNYHLSDYDILVGVISDQKSFKFSTITIKSGKYLIFEKSGEIEKIIVELWHEIWNFFEINNIKRAYSTDFEKYIDHDKVEIWISIL